MSLRAERKAAAAARRLEWRTRWSKLARAELERVKNIEHAVRIVGEDMQKMADEQPQLRSEIIRAGNEFLDKLAVAVAKAGSTP
jgi:hypothetical protein